MGRVRGDREHGEELPPQLHVAGLAALPGRRLLVLAGPALTQLREDEQVRAVVAEHAPCDPAADVHVGPAVKRQPAFLASAEQDQLLGGIVEHTSVLHDLSSCC